MVMTVPLELLASSIGVTPGSVGRFSVFGVATCFHTTPALSPHLDDKLYYGILLNGNIRSSYTLDVYPQLFDGDLWENLPLEQIHAVSQKLAQRS